MMPKVLVANRGEIAIRILRSASELGWETVALYTENDTSHATFADEAVKLERAADYMDVEVIVKAALTTECTHLHPGYGFLSENPTFPVALGSQVTYIGPSPAALRIASDKMLSRELALSLGIPIADGMGINLAKDIRGFIARVDYPVIIKALDGGGGRGIRVIRDEAEIEEAFQRCLGESPSKQLFVEKMLTGPGWKHVEVQVIGDGKHVSHLWERECSVQRRFQKIIEIAPSRLPRDAVRPLLDASLKMAKELEYKGLGTFEFLINFNLPSPQWVFLEINPRVQVEHTVTEEITNVDLVRAQLLLFAVPSVTLSDVHLAAPLPPPNVHAIQLRVTAEDPEKGFQLSPGKFRAHEVLWPGGRGVRVDTWLTSSGAEEKMDLEWIVGTEFDSLLAKIIVKGATFEEASEKGVRALRELRLQGTPQSNITKITTNVPVLLGTLSHLDWKHVSGAIDTLWLERNLQDVLQLGLELASIAHRKKTKGLDSSPGSTSSLNSSSAAVAGRTNILLQPGSLFHLTLSNHAEPSLEPGVVENAASSQRETKKHTITIASIGHNAFPEVLSGSILSTFIDSNRPITFSLVQSTSASTASSGEFELANPNDPTHIAAPMTGKIVELHPAFKQAQNLCPDSNSRSADYDSRIRVRKGEAMLILSVMKMENVIAAPFDGYVERVGSGVRGGAIISDGMLVCVFQSTISSRL